MLLGIQLTQYGRMVDTVRSPLFNIIISELKKNAQLSDDSTTWMMVGTLHSTLELKWSLAA